MSLKSAMKSLSHNPLDPRPYKYKKAAFNFFCPLCRTERAMSASHRLTLKNYIQISLITIVISSCLYPFMQLRGLFSFFIIWALFEGTRRVLFRKEVPCPHCGFDAGWYKKDVKVARKKVEEFWSLKNQNLTANSSNLETELQES